MIENKTQRWRSDGKIKIRNLVFEMRKMESKQGCWTRKRKEEERRRKVKKSPTTPIFVIVKTKASVSIPSTPKPKLVLSVRPTPALSRKRILARSAGDRAQACASRAAQIATCRLAQSLAHGFDCELAVCGGSRTAGTSNADWALVCGERLV
jgi:hypothetical protein